MCFTCHEPWALGHSYTKGKAHYIEVLSGNEQEDGVEQEDEVGGGELQTTRGSGGGGAPPPLDGDLFKHAGGIIASLRGVPKYITLRIRARFKDNR